MDPLSNMLSKIPSTEWQLFNLFFCGRLKIYRSWQVAVLRTVSEQCFTSPPTQYRLYGRRFLQVKRPNQQYQSTEGRSTKVK